MTSASPEGLLLYAVGDVAPDRDDPRDGFALTRDALRRSDVAYCQLGVNWTQRGDTQRGIAGAADAIRESGFSVASWAGNHRLDGCPDGFNDTIEGLRAVGLAVVGAGPSIAGARRPVIIDRYGVSVAFLAYGSILPANSWANRGDLTAMGAEIAAAKRSADLAVVSLHWDDHFSARSIAYQRQVAHAAIDAGADLILGHHAHVLNGVEIYKDRAIFYSLRSFAVDLRSDEAHAEGDGWREIQLPHRGWVPDSDGLYDLPLLSRMTVIATARLTQHGVQHPGFLPAWINRAGQPEIVKHGDQRFDKVVRYMKHMSASQDLAVRYDADGDVVLVRELLVAPGVKQSPRASGTAHSG